MIELEPLPLADLQAQVDRFRGLVQEAEARVEAVRALPAKQSRTVKLERALDKLAGARQGLRNAERVLKDRSPPTDMPDKAPSRPDSASNV